MATRNFRFQHFNEKHLDKIAIEYDVRLVKKTYSYIIYNTNYGDIEYFTKSDKVCIQNKSKWLNDGLKWLKNNIIKNI